MMPIFLAICFIATTVAETDAPLSTACLAAWLAMPSVILAFSVFCAMDDVICSIEALVSSTLVACSLEACESDFLALRERIGLVSHEPLMPFTRPSTVA